MWPSRIGVVGRDSLLCDALRAALKAVPYETIDHLEGESPVNVVVIAVGDVTDGCHLVSEVLMQRPDTGVVAVGNGCVDEEIVALIEAGAKAYVDHSQSFAQLLSTIEAVLQMRAPASGRITAQVIRKLRELSRGTEGALISSLTERELEILRLLAQGQGNKQIAEALQISLNTVKNHVHHILEKLQARGRRDAARIALYVMNLQTPGMAGKRLDATGEVFDGRADAAAMR